MDNIECQPCHERIEHAKAVLHEEINAMLAHHGQVAELLIITRQQDETFADQSLSHLDRAMQWALSKLRGRAA